MRKLMAAATLIAALGVALPATAQDRIEGRVGKLESEMRAVQRKIFPAGVPVEPQITAPAAPVTEGPGAPSSSALADLTQRVSALESSIQSVTGQVEQANYRVRQLEEAFNAYKTATDARLKAIEPAALPAAAPGAGDGAAPPPVVATRPADPERAAAIAAVERPNTGDPAEDGYTYGFRLWTAKLYPEAAVELKAVADKYPKHRRASFAQNLLGRAYLDDGKPSLASIAFYDGYQKFPDGERAPDSLLYLAKSLVALKKPNADVCKVYDELNAVYGAKLPAAIKADVAKGKAAAKCG